MCSMLESKYTNGQKPQDTFDFRRFIEYLEIYSTDSYRNLGI